MIALLALTKILKLEFLALAKYWADVVPTEIKAFVSYDSDCHLGASERAFYRHFFTSCQFAINADGLWFTYQCLEAVFNANTNRFVKSSFALSLLWTARYFSALELSYTPRKQKEIALTYFIKAFKALESFFQQYPNQSLECSSDPIHDYVMFCV